MYLRSSTDLTLASTRCYGAQVPRHSFYQIGYLSTRLPRLQVLRDPWEPCLFLLMCIAKFYVARESFDNVNDKHTGESVSLSRCHVLCSCGGQTRFLCWPLEEYNVSTDQSARNASIRNWKRRAWIPMLSYATRKSNRAPIILSGHA
jgi:hypothetical protein